MTSFAWTPLDVRPLHTGEQPMQWWACSDPDRPAGRWTCFDYRCAECARLALATTLDARTERHTLAHAGPADDPTLFVCSRRELAEAALAELHADA